MWQPWQPAFPSKTARPGAQRPRRTTPRRLRRGERQLVEVERRQLRGDQIGLVPDMAEAVLRSHRKLLCVVQPVVVEVAAAVHFEVRDERVPVGHGAPAGVGRKVDAGEPERRRDQRRRRLSVGPECLAVEEEHRVELARPPAGEDLVDRRLVDAEDVGERLLVRRQPDDRADVQVAVRPAVEAATDAGGEGVVDHGVAGRTGETHRRQPATAVEEALDADDGIQLQQRQRHRRVVQVDLAGLDRGRRLLRDRRRVDLEPGGQRGFRAEARADAAVLRAGDRAMQLQRVAPERLVSERVVAEDVPPGEEEGAAVPLVACVGGGT